MVKKLWYIWTIYSHMAIKKIKLEIYQLIDSTISY